jgi:hypothetical protein
MSPFVCQPVHIFPELLLDGFFSLKKNMLKFSWKIIEEQCFENIMLNFNVTTVYSSISGLYGTQHSNDMLKQLKMIRDNC